MGRFCTVLPLATLNTTGTFVLFHPGPPSTLLGRSSSVSPNTSETIQRNLFSEMSTSTILSNTVDTVVFPHYWKGCGQSASVYPLQYIGLCSLSTLLVRLWPVSISLPSAIQWTVVFPHYWEGCCLSSSTRFSSSISPPAYSLFRTRGTGAGPILIVKNIPLPPLADHGHLSDRCCHVQGQRDGEAERAECKRYCGERLTGL